MNESSSVFNSFMASLCQATLQLFIAVSRFCHAINEFFYLGFKLYKCIWYKCFV